MTNPTIETQSFPALPIQDRDFAMECIGSEIRIWKLFGRKWSMQAKTSVLLRQRGLVTFPGPMNVKTVDGTGWTPAKLYAKWDKKKQASERHAENAAKVFAQFPDCQTLHVFYAGSGPSGRYSFNGVGYSVTREQVKAATC